jgi:hypothetical protein
LTPSLPTFSLPTFTFFLCSGSGSPRLFGPNNEVQRKGVNLDKRMVYEKKKEMREKIFMEPPGWILGTLKRELNLFELCGNETVDDFHDQHDKAPVYWRQNHQ